MSGKHGRIGRAYACSFQSVDTELSTGYALVAESGDWLLPYRIHMRPLEHGPLDGDSILPLVVNILGFPRGMIYT